MFPYSIMAMVKKLVISTLVAVCCVVIAPIAADDCRHAINPSTTALERMFSQLFVNQTIDTRDYLSMYGINPFYNVGVIESRNIDGGFSKNYPSTRTAHLYGRRRCNARKNKSGRQGKDEGDHDTIMERSTCPWYLVFKEDANRYPHHLITARCRCRKCQDNGNSNYDKTHACKPITTKVMALRKDSKVCPDGVFKYSRYYETVTVGCTCAKKRKSHTSQNAKTPV